MIHLDLFAGIGGFSLAADWTWPDVEHIFVEIDPFCQKVLRKHWPESEIHSDIKKFHPGRTVDLLTCGWPCQPYSVAGKRRGAEDDRALWPEIPRIIELSKPVNILAENVYGILNIDSWKTIDMVCSDLENLGYERPLVLDLTADSEGLQTMERHVWIITTTTGKRRKRSQTYTHPNNRNERKLQGTNKRINEGWDLSKTRFRNVGERLSRKLAPNQRDGLRALGNAIIPQVAATIMQAIKEIECL